MDGLQHIIEQKYELLVRETFSRLALNRSEDMSSEMKDRYIEYLADEIQKSNMEKEAMRLVMEDFLTRQKELEEKLSELSELRKIQSSMKSELEKEIKERKKAELKVARLIEKLKFANKNRFGSKKQNVRKDDKDDETPDRNQEKEDYDGTDDSPSTKTVSSGSATSTAVTTNTGKERDLSNRPDTYRTMGVMAIPLSTHAI